MRDVGPEEFNALLRRIALEGKEWHANVTSVGDHLIGVNLTYEGETYHISAEQLCRMPPAATERPRCGECGASMRVVDAEKLLRECIRCGSRQG